MPATVVIHARDFAQPGVPPQSISTATVNGTGVDISAVGFEGVVTLACSLGAVGTSGLFRVEDSADNSTFGTPAGGAITTAALTGANTSVTLNFDVRNVKRYVRAVCVAVGVVLMGATFIGTKKVA